MRARTLVLALPLSIAMWGIIALFFRELYRWAQSN